MQLQIALLVLQIGLGYAHCAARLIATAIVSNASFPDPWIECWRFDEPLQKYPTVGAAMTLADTTNVTYVVLPPRSEEGVHKPPHPMLFVLLSGLAHVRTLDGADDIWIMEGVNNVVVAADDVGHGHYTDYPSDKETAALQLPFKDGKAPGHVILHRGACKASSQVQVECDGGEESRGAFSDDL
ncbi:hypothetical protein CONLIGDRAFT_163829 [Coniochaeta ligniaria NRRL 30616]|uniref:Cupin 2 conserved barrel domain-containing protein n=1 Tax=Coniochaeta ligniaria NRRL 30616 TaxID=1408157 RepID=A0A1J7JIJ4_9PEZI|nr:hypothetical protein CONLIGDRAFT_163829 [Coniochaeta ligniaria NRRL 30616]